MGTSRLFLLAAALVVPSVLGAAAANAGPNYMPGGERTTQPIGHYELCQRMPQECAQKTGKGQPVELTRRLWAAVVDINNAVNTMIAPRTDQEMWGKEEVWSYPDREGDCEDYALEKRKELMALGVPAGNLLITVVRQPNGDGHAVLTMRTSLGDFVLDNLEPKVLAWTDTEYQFLKRQSERNSGVWVAVNDSRAIAVGSVK
jgi:predicted transglutaminase-like cysteine proteinase